MRALSRLFDAAIGKADKQIVQINYLQFLNTITASYSDTYDRYKDNADRMEAAFDDIELLKKVVQEHSRILQNIL